METEGPLLYLQTDRSVKFLVVLKFQSIMSSHLFWTMLISHVSMGLTKRHSTHSTRKHQPQIQIPETQYLFKTFHSHGRYPHAATKYISFHQVRRSTRRPARALWLAYNVVDLVYDTEQFLTTLLRELLLLYEVPETRAMCNINLWFRNRIAQVAQFQRKISHYNYGNIHRCGIIMKTS
jgi:hypothetical protein